jgi:hypothetical protein
MKRPKRRAPGCTHDFFPNNDDNFSFALLRSAALALSSAFSAGAGEAGAGP